MRETENRKESLGRVRLKVDFSSERPLVTESLEAKPESYSASFLWT